ncbi:MAG TPA: hypothetical protein VFD84_00185 [Candidatus Binatia bacterium]|jgi:hypothetical protein|nr:hypothetical protein [Candidatus Binatia bacterium]
MTALLIGLAVLAAIGATVLRRRRRARIRDLAAAREGGSDERAIPVTSYDEMDAWIARRACVCGGRLAHVGEGTHAARGRRFRIVRARCTACDQLDELYFDTTDVPR